ncbi:unnamed protein product [Diamesa serratosioi]
MVAMEDEVVKNLKDEFEFDYKDAKTPSFIHIIFLNRTLRILTVLGIFCILLPIFDYSYFYSDELVEQQMDELGICSHNPMYQISCGDKNISKVECLTIECCHSRATGCYHFLPSKYQYKMENKRTWSSEEVLIPTLINTPLTTTFISKMKLNVREINDETLSINIYDPEKYKPTQTVAATDTSTRLYKTKVFEPEIFIEVQRKLNNKTILSTARGPLIASEDYFEWTVFLNSWMIMGLDEILLKHGHKILLNNEYTSVIPYILAFDSETSNYHCLHFSSFNSPTEIEFIKSNVIIIRMFQSDSFEMTLFVGPNYEDVYKQIKEHNPVNYIPPDYWGLGVHFCKTDQHFDETDTQKELQHFFSEDNLDMIPFDSHCISSKVSELAISKNSSESIFYDYEDVIEAMQAYNKSIIMHISMSILEVNNANELFHKAVENKLLIRDEDNLNNFAGMYGKTKKVVYLDYLKSAEEITDLLEERWFEIMGEVNVQGIFLSSNFLPDDTVNKTMNFVEDFKFKPKNLRDSIKQLVPLNLKLTDGSLLIHQLNNYANNQIKSFNGLNIDKKLCISESYRETSDCGMLFKEPQPSWLNFKKVVDKTIYYSMIGMSFYGSSICGGNNEKVMEDLCIKWYQFGIFTPLFYVTSNKIPTKFTKYGERIMIQAIRIRYSLLGYMNTIMLQKKPLLLPMHIKYIELASQAEKLSDQFMFGDSLLVALVLSAREVEIEIHFPEKYFEFWSGLEIPPESINFAVVMSDVPIFLRAGHIVALYMAHESLTAAESRLEPLQIIVGLKCTERFLCHAKGHLLLQENFGFDFAASENHLNITIMSTNYKEDRQTICSSPITNSTFLLAKIYGLGVFKDHYLDNYLPLNLDLCQKNWNVEKSFSFQI